VEIRRLIDVLWRRAWLVLALPALVLALGLLRPAAQPQPGYVANMRFSVGVMPVEAAPAPDYYTYDRYYSWLTAEYLADDLSQIVRSREVAEAVRAEAARQGLEVDVAPEAIQGSSGAGKQHRILTVTLNWPDRDQLRVLANALTTVLSQGQTAYFEQFRSAGTPIVMHPIDPPSIVPAGISLRSKVEVPLRLLLALVAGVALAFFVEYLDDSVHGPEDLEAHGLAVVGAIPRSGALPWSERRLR